MKNLYIFMHYQIFFVDMGLGDNMSFYDILQITATATITEIQSAYRAIMKQVHPDKNRNDKNKESEEVSKMINEAYETLNDPAKKKLYDYSLLMAKNTNCHQHQHSNVPSNQVCTVLYIIFCIIDFPFLNKYYIYNLLIFYIFSRMLQRQGNPISAGMKNKSYKWLNACSNLSLILPGNN